MGLFSITPLNFGDGSDGAAILDGTNTYPWAQLWTEYTFTVTASTAFEGELYTNNGHNFVVKSTIIGGTTLVMYGDGAPAASGTLAVNGSFSTGQSAASISFSSFTSDSTHAVYQMLRSTNATDITINANVYLFPAANSIRGNGTLTINSGGFIWAQGSNGLPGGYLAGAVSQGNGGVTGGGLIGGTGPNSASTTPAISQPELGGSGNGQSGGTSVAASPGSPGNVGGTVSLGVLGATGGNGGSGGSGSSGAGGSAIPGPVSGNKLYYRGLHSNLIFGGGYVGGGEGGSSGSSGGGDASNPGGGGGAGGGGGGVIGIWFKNVINNGSVTANGGDGGNGAVPSSFATGTGGGGGGGGGQGGLIYVIANKISGTGGYSAIGGNTGSPGPGEGGAGTPGTFGTTGGNGIVLKFQASTGTWL